MRLTTLAGVRMPLCMNTIRSPGCKVALGMTGDGKDMTAGVAAAGLAARVWSDRGSVQSSEVSTQDLTLKII